MMAKLGKPVRMCSPWGELAIAMGGTRELAFALGVSSQTVNRWAAGTRNPSYLVKKEVKRLCSRYRIEIPVNFTER